jgi:hypothetical protein
MRFCFQFPVTHTKKENKDKIEKSSKKPESERVNYP